MTFWGGGAFVLFGGGIYLTIISILQYRQKNLKLLQNIDKKSENTSKKIYNIDRKTAKQLMNYLTLQ